MCTSTTEAGLRKCDRDTSDYINQDKSVKENTSSRDAFAAAQMRLRDTLSILKFGDLSGTSCDVTNLG